MTEEEKKAAEESAKKAARLVWDSWIMDSTDENIIEYDTENG